MTKIAKTKKAVDEDEPSYIAEGEVDVLIFDLKGMREKATLAVAEGQRVAAKTYADNLAYILDGHKTFDWNLGGKVANRGSMVTVKDLNTGNTETFWVGGSYRKEESRKGVPVYTSDDGIGKAVLERQPGEEVKYFNNVGEKKTAELVQIH